VIVVPLLVPQFGVAVSVLITCWTATASSKLKSLVVTDERVLSLYEWTCTRMRRENCGAWIPLKLLTFVPYCRLIVWRLTFHGW
jgi:hypothetical protein